MAMHGLRPPPGLAKRPGLGLSLARGLPEPWGPPEQVEQGQQGEKMRSFGANRRFFGPFTLRHLCILLAQLPTC